MHTRQRSFLCLERRNRVWDHTYNTYIGASDLANRVKVTRKHVAKHSHTLALHTNTALQRERSIHESTPNDQRHTLERTKAAG